MEIGSTAKLIERLMDENHYEAADALTKQAQKIEELEAMIHELMDDLFEARCEMAGLVSRGLLQRPDRTEVPR